MNCQMKLNWLLYNNLLLQKIQFHILKMHHLTQKINFDPIIKMDIVKTIP